MICNALATKTVSFAIFARTRALFLVGFNIRAILNYRHVGKIEILYILNMNNMNFSKTILFLASIATAVFAQYKVINNPYESVVDWETYGKYKAAFHVHTTYSDGNSTVKDMLMAHYDRDFSIVTITDHGRFNESWDKEPEKGAPDEGNLADWSSSSKAKVIIDPITKNQINMGTYSDTTIKNRTSREGMIGLKCGSELLAYPYMFSNGNAPIDVGHSFTAGKCFTYSGKDSLTKVLNLSKLAGGINYIHHPGRYTGGGYTSDSAAGAAISNNRTYIDKYVQIIKNTDALGMEIMNKLDNESKSDRIFYDNILKALAPEKRNVWAFSSDDSHSTDEVGYSFNVMLLDTLTEAAIMESMKKGTFYAVARVDRREKIHHNINGKDTPDRGTAATLQWLNDTIPSISKIAVDKDRGIITITGEDYNTIEWIADGVKIISENRNAAGNTLHLNDNAYEGKIGRYVRAHLKSAKGIAYTQPFYVQNPNVKVSPWYTIPADLTATENEKLSSVILPTGWTWVEDEQPVELGSQIYPAIFTPSNLNIYNIDTVDVSVMGYPKGFKMYEISKTGDNYYYFGRTNPKRLDSAFDISSVSGWPNVPTPIGFSKNTDTLVLATKIDTVSPNRHTWTYFTKQFMINNHNFKVSELRSVFGRHRIDDAMIMYINGTEVYRFNTSGSSTKIGAAVSWDKYAGNAVDRATQIEFTINSDYDDRLISGSSSSALRDAASRTNFEKALKPGINVITCVVGNQSATSSDLFFDLQMNITAIETNPQPFIDIGTASIESTIYTYDGSPQKPVVKLGAQNLVEQVDYTAIYTNNINAGGADEARMEITGKGSYIGGGGFSFTINKANQLNLNITPVSGKKFGDAAFDLKATGGNENGTITYERVSGPGTVTSAGRVTITGAENIVVKATKTASDNYNPVTSPEYTINVAKAQLTLTAENKTVSVGGSEPAYTYKATGFVVSSDTQEKIITTQPTLSVAGFSSSVANSSFVITISGGATTSPNYEIKTYANGTLTIKDKTPVTINGLSAQSGTYNGSPQVGYTGTAKFTGGTPTTELTASYTGRNGTTYNSAIAPTNAGSYTVKLTLDNDPGYSSTISINFDINKAPLTLKADNKSIAVGDPAPASTFYTYTVSGLVGSDKKESIITTQPTFSLPTNFSSSTAKTVDITISGGATTSPNYEIKTYTKGTLTVANKTTVTISGLIAQSGPYNGNPRTGYAGTPIFKDGTTNVTPTNITLTPTYTGRIGTTYGSTSTAPTNAGDYTVKLSLNNDPSYRTSTSAPLSIDFTINKASLTLKADDKTISMGDPVPTYTYSVLGLVNPDTKESIITTPPTLNVVGFSSLMARTFDIIITGGAITSPNYVIAARTNGTFTVNSAIQDSISLSEPTPIRLPKIPSSNHIAQIRNGINLTAINKAVVEIYGLRGNLIQKHNFKSGVYSIPLAHLPKGIYFARARFGSEIKILRVVVR